MFGYYYYQILRKIVNCFGALFDNVYVVGTDNQGDVFSTIKVPIRYGPTQKFLARVEQVPTLNKPIQITLPRMSFELIGMSYDSSRKATATQTFLVRDPHNNCAVRKSFLPVPYNLNLELSIFTKKNDDMFQIIEQIVPYFQPYYTMTVDLVQEINEKRDIQVNLDNIIMTDNYEGDYTERRALIWTLKFTAKTYFFAEIPGSSDTSKDIITSVSIGYIAGVTGGAGISGRDSSNSVLPRAIKNYTGNPTTTLAENISATDRNIIVVDATDILPNTYITINDEELFVRSKTGNTLAVDRGRDSTIATPHVLGADIYRITDADNALVQPGDKFGIIGGLL
jgi:hypothetical protein